MSTEFRQPSPPNPLGSVCMDVLLFCCTRGGTNVHSRTSCGNPRPTLGRDRYRARASLLSDLRTNSPKPNEQGRLSGIGTQLTSARPTDRGDCRQKVCSEVLVRHRTFTCGRNESSVLGKCSPIGVWLWRAPCLGPVCKFCFRDVEVDFLLLCVNGEFVAVLD